MPRTFLVKKFKKHDAHSAVWVCQPEKRDDKRRLFETDAPKLLQSYRIPCLHKGDNEEKTSIEWEENTQGNHVSMRKKRTAIFMPISRRGSWGELREKKRAKSDSTLVENDEGLNGILKITQPTEDTRKLNKTIPYHEVYSTRRTGLRDDEISIRNTPSMKVHNSRINGENDRSDRQSIKRPVALLPDRCSCMECQIRKKIYFGKHTSHRKHFEIIERRPSNADKANGQEMESKLTRGRDGSYFTNPMITERFIASSREEEFKEREHCYKGKLSYLNVDNNPEDLMVGKVNRDSPWSYRKSEHERIEEKPIHSVYSSEESIDGRLSTFKEEDKKIKKMTVTKVIDHVFRRGDLSQHHEIVRHLRSPGNEESNVVYSIGKYRRGCDHKEEYFRSMEYSKVFTSNSSNCEHGPSHSLMKKPENYELSDQEIRNEDKEKHRCLQREDYSPWMIIGKKELENKKVENRYESYFEDYEGINGYDKPLEAKENDGPLVGRLIKSEKEEEIPVIVKDYDKKSCKTWEEREPLSNREIVEPISKDEKESKEEYDMKYEESSSLEGFLLCKNDIDNISVKDKKVVSKQQKEKDSGKKSRALANWLERKRVAELNDAFERLRRMVPTYGNEDRSLSKIKTLRYATTYIRHLALIHEKQCRYAIEDLKKDLMKVLDMDPMLQRCHEHLESHCII